MSRWQEECKTQHQLPKLLPEVWPPAISGILTNLPTTGHLHPRLPSQLHDCFLGVGIAPLSMAPTPEQLCCTKPLQAWGPVPLMCTAFLWDGHSCSLRVWMEAAPTCWGAGLVVKWLLQDMRCLPIMAGTSGDREALAPLPLLGWLAGLHLLNQITAELWLATHLILPPHSSQSDISK